MTTKQNARVKVFNAIRDGVLIRQPCEKCGAAYAQAHHDDYQKPLDVRWLCASCHRLLHNELKPPLVRRSFTLTKTGPIDGHMGIEDAARALGRSERTVRWWLANAVMAGERFGRDWMVRKEEVERMKTAPPPKRGRPPKPKTS